MVQVCRDAQRVELIDEAAAAGANGRSDIVPLLQYQNFAPGAGQYFRCREPRWTTARDHHFIFLMRQALGWQDARPHRHSVLNCKLSGA